jgi:hypothetical protein
MIFSKWFCLILLALLPVRLLADAVITTRAMTASTIAEVFVEPEGVMSSRGWKGRQPAEGLI